MSTSSKMTITRSVASSLLGLLLMAGCGPAKTNVHSAVNDPSSPASGSLGADQFIASQQAGRSATPEATTTVTAPVVASEQPAEAAAPVAETETTNGIASDIKGGTVRFTRTFKDASGKVQKSSGTTPACLARAISTLKKYSPSGYRTYQRLVDKTVFNFFVSDCSSDEEFYLINLPTAVHESNHMVRAETGAYHLVSDEMLKVPTATGYFQPGEMDTALIAHLKVKDDFYNTYLAPSADASSRTDFTYLLDELAAYTVDFQVANDMTQLVPLTQRQVGLPALMTFVSFYATYAHVKHPDIWNQMSTNPEMKSALSKLWAQAETSLTVACQKGPDPSGDDRHYIKHLCDAKQMSSMATIIGRKTVCPSACH